MEEGIQRSNRIIQI